MAAMNNPVALKHRTVNFQIRHVHIPDACEVLMELRGNDLLQGEVVDVTQNGGGKGWFAVVHVDGLKTPLIVPVDQILNAVVPVDQIFKAACV
jgi:hypothetical protein